MVEDLQEAGLKQEEIAEYCGCGQGLISDLKHERRGKRLSFEIGSRLTALWKKQCKKRLQTP